MKTIKNLALLALALVTSTSIAQAFVLPIINNSSKVIEVTALSDRSINAVFINANSKDIETFDSAKNFKKLRVTYYDTATDAHNWKYSQPHGESYKKRDLPISKKIIDNNDSSQTLLVTDTEIKLVKTAKYQSKAKSK